MQRFITGSDGHLSAVRVFSSFLSTGSSSPSFPLFPLVKKVMRPLSTSSCLLYRKEGKGV